MSFEERIMWEPGDAEIILPRMMHTRMLHRRCGGMIVNDGTKIYCFHDSDNELQEECALRCIRCKQEVLGDDEIFLEGYDEDIEADLEIREAILPSEY